MKNSDSSIGYKLTKKSRFRRDIVKNFLLIPNEKNCQVDCGN